MKKKNRKLFLILKIYVGKISSGQQNRKSGRSKKILKSGSLTDQKDGAGMEFIKMLHTCQNFPMYLESPRSL